MDYEKKYKEALERARIWQNHLYDTNDKDYANELNYIFPELAESEDEKIRKALIRFHKSTIEVDGIKGEDIIAWLEKQGDTNETINKDEFAQGVLKGAAINLITWIDYNAAEGNMCLSNMECKDVEDALVSGDWNKIYAYIKKKLEKQYEYNPYSGTSFKYNGHIWGMCARDGGVEILVDGEIKERVFLDNKPQDKYAQEATKEEKVDNQNCVNFADDVKPKFKVGDWVVFDNGNVEHITSVGTHGYTFDDGDYLLHDECDKIAHLWSIQDAKDGDVITYSETNGYKVIEPKFKVGDWISNDMCDVHIASIENGMYYFDEGDGLSIVFVDEHYHLWTIEDAMDGDVLVSRSPFIYGKQCPYGGLNWCNNKFIKASNFIFTDSPVHPATKEQRDFLFQKMKEAGYTFDFEKKELKKLGQPEVTKTSDQEEMAEIPFGAKDSELQEATYFIPKGFHAEIDDNKVVIKKGEKPAAWSKKDEKMFKYALNMIEWYSGKNEDKSRYVSDWLKSLKQRIGG